MNRYILKVLAFDGNSKTVPIVASSPKQAIKSILHYYHGDIPDIIKWRTWIMEGVEVLSAFYDNDKGIVHVDCQMCLEDRIRNMRKRSNDNE